MIDIHIYDESALGLSSKNNPNIISIYGWIELFEEKLPKKMGEKNLISAKIYAFGENLNMFNTVQSILY